MPDTKYTTPEQIEAMRRALCLAGRKGEGGRPQGRKRLDALQIGRQVIGIAGRVLFGAAVLLLLSALVSILVVKSRGEIPGLLGYHLYVVESGSMEPTLPVGTVIISREPRDASKLEANDIVTFRTSSDAVVTHRIIEVIRGDGSDVSYRTRGDNPVNSPDPELLTPDRVMAVFLAAIPFS